MNIFRKILAGLFIAGALPAAAQTQDFGSWTTFSLSKKVADKFRVGTDLELRMRDNLTDYNLFYVNLGGTYKPLDWLSISATYRFIHKHKDDGTYGIRHRYYNDFAAKFKPGKFTLSYRARIQWEVRTTGYSDKYGLIPEIYWRNKFDIKYKATDKITPYIGTEIRFQLLNPRVPYNEGLTFDRDRAYAGMDYSINDNHTLGVFFLHQIEFNVEDPETLNIIGVEYSIALD
ncbi:MAG: Protein of unknown function (DUF2490) [Bacteroidetes bacterium]|nr:MAG: Protein of unknown function (DUF2490) [Bacteroidota bacterium]